MVFPNFIIFSHGKTVLVGDDLLCHINSLLLLKKTYDSHTYLDGEHDILDRILYILLSEDEYDNGYDIWQGKIDQSKTTESKLKFGEFFLATVMQ